MNIQDIIERLALSPHVEGGYFRRTYCSAELNATASRHCMSSIFYLLTQESPVGHLHCNRSDIVHYYQGEGVIRHTLIHPDSRIEQVLMGPRLDLGHQWQMTVSGGVWKASELIEGRWGLVSEAVCPAFDFEDMQLCSGDQLRRLLPERSAAFLHLIRGAQP